MGDGDGVGSAAVALGDGLGDGSSLAGEQAVARSAIATAMETRWARTVMATPKLVLPTRLVGKRDVCLGCVRTVMVRGGCAREAAGPVWWPRWYVECEVVNKEIQGLQNQTDEILGAG